MELPAWFWKAGLVQGSTTPTGCSQCQGGGTGGVLGLWSRPLMKSSFHDEFDQCQQDLFIQLRLF